MRPCDQDLNAEFYTDTDLVGDYSSRSLRPVEELIFDRYRSELSGSVLSVGCGTGRLVSHLCHGASAIHGIDISAAMVEYCRRTVPKGTFSQTDMRDLGSLDHDPFDVVLASFNVLDAVDHADRRRTLAGFRDALASGGLLIMSSHNLAIAPRVVGPGRDVLAHLRSRELRIAARGAFHLPRRVRNNRRLRGFEATGSGFAIVNDVAHDYSLLHYYVSPAAQRQQLAAHGFELIECLDLEGRRLQVGDESESPELHYVARL